MFRLKFFLTAVAVVSSASPALAQVSIRVPFVRIQTGGPGGGTYVRAPFVQVATGGALGGVNVQAPFVNVDVPPDYPVYAQQPPVVSNSQPAIPVQPNQPAIPVLPQQNQPSIPTQPQQNQPFVPGVPQQNQQFVPGVPQQNQPNAPILPAPTPMPSQQPPAVVIPGPIVHSPGQPMTHYQFARVFQPIPGRHVVTLIHPGICRKVVTVCFTLPPGCPRVCVHRRSLEFDYGNHCVKIRFALFGRVRVRYD